MESILDFLNKKETEYKRSKELTVPNSYNDSWLDGALALIRQVRLEIQANKFITSKPATNEMYEELKEFDRKLKSKE